MSDGSAPFVVLTATLFVCVRHCQSPADVPRLLSLVEMRFLCRERLVCERKAKKDASAAVVCRAACVSRAPPADASRPALACWGRPAWSLRINHLPTITPLLTSPISRWPPRPIWDKILIAILQSWLLPSPHRGCGKNKKAVKKENLVGGKK